MGSNLLERKFSCPWARNYHQIHSGSYRVRMLQNCLSDKPLDPVPRHSSSHFLADHNS